MKTSISQRARARRSIWDLIGRHNLYDRHITFTKHETLRRYLKSERDFLDEAILGLPAESAVLIEIGCGTGRLLLQYIDPYSPLAEDRKITMAKRLKLASKIVHVVGIDFSRQMIRRLRQNLQKYNVSEIGNEVSVVQRDVTQLSAFLPALLKKHNLENYCKVFCIMLCTLGNMRSQTRKTVLQEIRKVMNPGDVLIASVWNRTLFKKGVQEIYKEFTSLIGDFNEKNVNYEEAEFETEAKYYIHWFSKRELKELFGETGFKVEDISPKKTDFFILVKATAS